MLIQNLENSDFVVANGITIKEAMSIITANHRGSVVVVDGNNHLVGVLSDGDIRRSLVRGINMLSTIDNSLNHNPIFIKENDESKLEQASKIFNGNSGIQLIPIVNENNLLCSLVVRD